MHLSTMTETGQFDTQRATLVLTDSAVQDRLVDQVQQTLRRRGYAGLDVDFEFLPGQLAAAYAAFLARLRRLLNSQGFFLWAALAPKTSARQAGLLYEGHDYAAVGAAVDGVLLMTYEWGYTAGPPMAVSPLPQRPDRVGLRRDGDPAGEDLLGPFQLRLRLAPALCPGRHPGALHLQSAGHRAGH